MKKRFITEIDAIANEGRTFKMSVALKRVANYIQVHYDPTFPEQLLVNYVLKGDMDKPLRHNKVLYYWDENDVPMRDRKVS